MNGNNRRRIRNRIAMRYRRKAKELGKPKEWKHIEINGKTFEQALAEAIENYEEGKEPLSPDEAIEEFKRGIMGNPDETPTAESEEKTEYTLDPQVLRLWNAKGEKERFDEMKTLEKEINRELEGARTPTCPRCRCFPCVCRD